MHWNEAGDVHWLSRSWERPWWYRTLHEESYLCRDILSWQSGSNSALSLVSCRKRERGRMATSHKTQDGGPDVSAPWFSEAVLSEVAITFYSMSFSGLTFQNERCPMSESVSDSDHSHGVCLNTTPRFRVGRVPIPRRGLAALYRRK